MSLLYISSKKNDGNGGGTYAIECWIVLLICTGAVFPGLILSPDRKAKEKYEEEKKKEEKEGSEAQSESTHLLTGIQSESRQAIPSTSNVAGPATLNVAGRTTSTGTTGSSSSSNPNPVKVSTKGEFFQAVLSSATQLFAVWFVFKGMDEMFAPVNSRAAFAFAKVVSCWIDETKFS